MASSRALAWIEAAIWLLLYGGLFILILGLATGAADPPVAWSLGIVGACMAAAGLVLIWVRSRLREPSA